MKNKNSALTTGIRAAVGTLLIATAATAVVLVGTFDAPAVVREPVALTMDTTHNAARTVVCDGGFMELGADPAQPRVAVPTGPAQIAQAGASSQAVELTRSVGGEGLPTALTVPDSEPLAAAQLQNVASETLRGASASSCTEPLNDQWLIGGSTDLGVLTTLNVANPGSVPATVDVTVFDTEGQVAALRTAGVIVAPGAQQTVSLNGYAPDRPALAVRVKSTGAPVMAALSVAHRVGLDSFGVSTVNHQAAPDTRLILAGVANANGEGRGPGDSGEGDPYPVIVRAFAPGHAISTATVRALDAKGHATPLGAIVLKADAVGELRVQTWPDGAAALEITSDVPIIAAALGSAESDTAHDYAWFTPSSAVAPGTKLPVAAVPGGELVLVHPGEGKAEVIITDAKGKAKKFTVSAGATRTLRVSNNSILEANAEVFAGVRYTQGAAIAAYPLLTPIERDSTLTVYTR